MGGWNEVCSAWEGMRRMCSEGTEVKTIGISSTMPASFTSPKSESEKMTLRGTKGGEVRRVVAPPASPRRRVARMPSAAAVSRGYCCCGYASIYKRLGAIYCNNCGGRIPREAHRER